MPLPEPDPRTSPEAEAGLVQRVVRWLRAGYPDGVPTQDYVALLGILRRTLTETELDDVVDQLADQVGTGEHLLTRQLVESRIADIVKGPIQAEDVVRVSARLAAAGSPLGSPQSPDQPADESIDRSAVRTASEDGTGVVGRVVGWLRADYPTGLPAGDYVPLLALLRRRLSDDEVREVGRLLVRDGLVSGAAPADEVTVDIGTAVAKVTSQLPTPADVDRVRDYLLAHGWPADLQV